DGAPLDEAAGHRLGGGDRGGREHLHGGGGRVVGGVGVRRPVRHPGRGGRGVVHQAAGKVGRGDREGQGRRVADLQAGEVPVAGPRVVDPLRRGEAAGVE